MPSPPRTFETEQEEEQTLEEAEGEEARVIIGPEEAFAGSNVAPSVIVVGETQAVRVERLFDPEEKAELVAQVISVMALTDLLNPRQTYQRWSTFHYKDTSQLIFSR